MLIILRHMSAAMNQSVCNDQIVLIILIYGDLMKNVSSIAVYSQYNGPVKILDVGHLSDARGNLYNENGNIYCVLHQYRADSNFLARSLPPFCRIEIGIKSHRKNISSLTESENGGHSFPKQGTQVCQQYAQV